MQDSCFTFMVNLLLNVTQLCITAAETYHWYFSAYSGLLCHGWHSKFSKS